MALKELAAALIMVSVATPAAAGHEPAAGAPPGTAATLYCMHIEAITGSRLEEVKCWTRAEWAENGVDVDKEWAREGVSTIG
jgi:hypothetical protein